MARQLKKFFLTVLVIFCVFIARGQTVELLHTFSGSDGAEPVGALIEGKDGNFYGMTRSGGTLGRGTVFRMTPLGNLTTLVSFDKTNGMWPASLVLATDGNFYGTTAFGGATNGSWGNGTVFKMTGSGELTTLFSFSVTNGRYPGSLIQVADGSFYGITLHGGAYDPNGDYIDGAGTAFRITSDGTMTLLTSFGANDADRGVPLGLIQAKDGNFYGPTQWGGSIDSDGTIFKMTPEGVRTEFFAFNFYNNTGTSPLALLEGKDGNFYGTTYSTIFRITPSGTFTVLRSLSRPSSPLMQANNGRFYGMTRQPDSSVILYKMTTNGIFSVVTTNNQWAEGTIMQASDGNLYITVENCVASTSGAIFKVTLAPPLKITHTANEILLSWPTNWAGCTLQVRTNLTSGSWTDSTRISVVISNEYVITNALANTAKFYRLRQ